MELLLLKCTDVESMMVNHFVYDVSLCIYVFVCLKRIVMERTFKTPIVILVGM